MVNQELINLIESNMDGFEGMNVDEVIKCALSITSAHLTFSAKRNTKDPNLLVNKGTAHCVGYATFCAAVCNYLFKKYRPDYM